MATVDETAAAVWAHGIPDPADSDKLKPASAMLGYARTDAYNAFVQTVANSQKLDALADQVAALAVAAGDPEAIMALVRSVINDTVLEVRPPS